VNSVKMTMKMDLGKLYTEKCFSDQFPVTYNFCENDVVVASLSAHDNV
jgi:hypothetical protein